MVANLRDHKQNSTHYKSECEALKRLQHQTPQDNATDDAGTRSLSSKHVQDDSINNKFNSTAESSKDLLMQQDLFLKRTMQMNVHMCLNRYVMLFMYSTMFHFIVCFVQFLTHMLHKCNISFHFSTMFLCFTTLHVHALEDGGYKHNNLYVSVCNILSWFETIFQVRNMKRRNVTTMKVRVNHVI